MKKIIVLMLGLFAGLAVVGCDQTTLDNNTQLDSETSLATLSYLSSGFLDLSTSDTSSTELSFSLLEDEGEPETEVEENLEDINIYIDLLKSFAENGATALGNVQVEVSDRTEYLNKMTINVQEDLYYLYYNVDALTGDISGIFVIGDVEYTITASNTLDDADEFEDEYDEDDDNDEFDDDDEEEDEDEYDDEDDEDHETTSEPATTTESVTTTEAANTTAANTTTADAQAGATVEETTVLGASDLSDTATEADDETKTEAKMELIARNGDDYIEITYKVETEGSESETKFEIEKFINGIESEANIKIEVDADEYKVEIEDGNDYYELKQESEDEGTVYKLAYEVNGVEGEIKIIETENELGETVYVYEIKEGDMEKEVDQEEPHSRGRDHEDDEDDDDDVTSTETA